MAKRITTPAPETITISLRLPGAKTHPNARPNRWRLAEAKRADKELAYYLALEAMKGRTFGWPAAVAQPTFTIANPRRDEDNLAAWLKAYYDGFQRAGVIKNDNGIRHEPPKVLIGTPEGVSITLIRLADKREAKR